MANIDRWLDAARQEGYSDIHAAARVCQDTETVVSI